MPTPKRRQSKARTRKRRSHDALSALSLSVCPRCSQKKLPHKVCENCGYYKGESIIEKEGA